MKLRNKFSGEIGILSKIRNGDELIVVTDTRSYIYKTLAEVVKDWEDYEEPKGYWHINAIGAVGLHTRTNGMTDSENSYIEDCQLEIGNYFENEEEAKEAVEKLKAWKRLKDKGFHWLWYNSTPAGNSVDFYIKEWDKEATRDLDLLFGGGDE